LASFASLREQYVNIWLDSRALLRGDMKTVLATLRRGLDSPEHGDFVR
jgi:hypothetical protein